MCEGANLASVKACLEQHWALLSWVFISRKVNRIRISRKGSVKAHNQRKWATQWKLGLHPLQWEFPNESDITERTRALPSAVVSWGHVVLAARGGVLGGHLALLSGSFFFHGKLFALTWPGLGLGVGRGERPKQLQICSFKSGLLCEPGSGLSKIGCFPSYFHF